MGGLRKPGNLGGFQPVNTLTGQKRDMPPLDRPAKKTYTDTRLAPVEGASQNFTTARFMVPGSQDGSLFPSQLDRPFLDEPKKRGTRRRGKRLSHLTGDRYPSSNKSASMDLTYDPILDDQDELSESHKTRSHKIHKLQPKTSGDAADAHILGTRTKPRRPAKDAPVHIDSEESQDELGGSSPPRATAKPQMMAARNLGRPAAASTSSRGDIAPTKWQQSKVSQESKPSGIGLPVKAAFRQQIAEYICPEDETGEGSQLYLRPVERSGLRAFTAEGEQSADHSWLSITADDTIVVVWARDCCFVKVRSRIGQLPLAGSLMGLKLGSPEDVNDLVRWLQTHLKMVAIQEEVQDPDKVPRSFHHIMEEVRAARISKDPQMAPHLASSPQATSSSQQPPPRHKGGAAPKPERRLLLRDRMKKPEDDTEVVEISKETVTKERNLRSRNKRETILVRDPTPPPPPPRWSIQNTGWADTWEMPLVFQRTTVDKDDIPRLDEGEFLNDNIIGFGLRFLFDLFSKDNPELNNRVFMLNTFFHEKLKSNRSHKGQINYDGVKNWTAKVDLFSYDYIVVPVNEHAHWWVAIICNPGKIDPDARSGPSSNSGHSGDGHVNGENKSSKTHGNLADNASSDVEMVNGIEQSARSSNTAVTAEVDKSLVSSPSCLTEAGGPTEVGSDACSTRKKEPPDSGRTRSGKDFAPVPKSIDPTEPKIITLDSMGNSHAASVNLLKHYLVAEFEHKKKKTISLTQLPPRMGMKAAHIPEQSNFHDCGVYVLGYIQEFARDPDRLIQSLLRKEKVDWTLNASKLRDLWRDTILREHKKYQDTHLPVKDRGSSAAVRTPKPDRHSPVVKATPDHGRTEAEVRPGSTSAKPSPIPRDDRPRTADAKTSPNNGPVTPFISTLGTPKGKPVEPLVSERRVRTVFDGLDDEVSLLSVSKDHPVESIENQNDVLHESSQTSRQIARPVDQRPAKGRSESPDVEVEFLSKLSPPQPLETVPADRGAASGNHKHRDGRISLGKGDFSFPAVRKYDNRPQTASAHRGVGEGEQSRYFQPKSPVSNPSPGILRPTVPLVQAAEMVTASKPRDTIDLTDD